MQPVNKKQNITTLQQLEPLARLTQSRLKELASLCVIESISQNLDPMRMNTQAAQSVYLVRGELGVRYTDGSKAILRAGTNASHHPVNAGRLQIQDTIALTPIEVVRIDTDLLDIMMTWDQLSSDQLSSNESYDMQHSTKEKSASKQVTRNQAARTASDWMSDTSVFSAVKLKNGVFSQLPPANIEQMFQRMTHIFVTAGQVIIKQGAEGDYFYLIERGTVIVTREKHADAEILAELQAGSAFGEDALVSDNKRNASVIMKTDGELLRLNKTDFIELLKAPIINHVNMAEAKEKVSQGAIWLDVRFASEYQFDHIKGAINAPLNELRSIAPTLNPTFNKAVIDTSAISQATQQEYIAYCQTGRRSAAAAFILAQYGVKATVLDGGMRGER